MFFLLMAVLFSCQQNNYSEKEPNNTISNATLIGLDQSISTDLSAENDIDYFKISLPRQGYLEINLQESESEVRINYFDSSGQIRSWQYLPDAVFIEKKGIHYFTLKNDLGNSAGQVQFLPRFIAEFDPTEPNNSRENAFEMTLNKPIQTAIFPRLDQDWFSIELAEKGYLKTSTKKVQGLRPEVYYIYENEKEVHRIRNWKYLPDVCPVRNPGEYFVFLHDAYDDEFSKQLFELEMNFIPEFDQYEPNDDLLTAKAIVLNETIKFFIFPRDDHDIFRFSLEKDADIFLELTKSSEIQIEFRFQINRNISEWINPPAEFFVPKGEIYLEFRGFDDRCCSQEEQEFIIKKIGL